MAKILQPLEAWENLVLKEIGGCNELLREILTNICMVANWNNFGSLVPPMKGLILAGRPGTGKTHLASAIARNSGLPYESINCPDIFQTNEGAGEAKLRLIFERLLAHTISILILDEVDIVASKSTSGTEARLFSTLMFMIDSLPKRKNNVFIMALTNRLHAVNPSLTRSGRLDRIYQLAFRTAVQRQQVLGIITQNLPFAPDMDATVIAEVARNTHGFVPSDLQSLTIQVALQLVREDNTATEAKLPAKNIVATLDHFKQALKIVRPSNLNEFQIKIPEIHFKDIYGLDDIIEGLQISVIDPFDHRVDFLRLGITPPRGVLVYGPPGVGKTALCCALAIEAKINFMLIEGSQLRSKIVGESERNIARMFAEAKSNAPCILFIDQIDILIPKRGTSSTTENTGDRIVTSFLTEMDGFFTGGVSSMDPEVNVLIVAATNRPEVLDPAILRPGRLDEHVFIGAPNALQRREIFIGLSSKMPVYITDEERELLLASTGGFSGADIENLLREAALICLREKIENEKILYKHLEQAMKIAKPSLLGYVASHPT